MREKLRYLLTFVLGILCTLTIIKYIEIKAQTKARTSDAIELRKIVETVNLVESVWVGDKKVDKKFHYESALRGIMSNLDDPYSEYLSNEELKDLSEGLNGVYSGVGMSIKKIKGEYMEVVSPFIGSPAFKKNIQIGDLITKINGKDIKDNTAIETSKMLRGPKGTKVNIEIIRKGLKEPLKIELVRDTIKLDNVEYKMLTKNIGYISLLQFGNGISNEIENAITYLKKQGMEKLILDLRTNPGGSLEEAVDLASLFVKEKKIVSLKYKNKSEKVFNRTKNQIFDKAMVILVNNGSASASEIVTGTLKDYNRATIIGEKTYGKGVAQNIINFKTGDALKVTIAKYSTPKNSDINKKGIEPDIYKTMEPLLSIKGYANETKLAKNNRIKEIEKILIEMYGEKKAKEYIKQGDVQLKAAIDYLNGKKVEGNKKEVK